MVMVLLALAAAPPAEKAVSLAAAQSWEELYLAFAAVSAKSYPAGKRPKVGASLTRGCQALLGEDAVMAFSLGEKAVEFSPSADALYCASLGAMKADQRTAAEATLKQGVKRFSKDFRFALELGRLYAEEGDADGARAALARIPSRAPQHADAQAVLSKLPAQEQAAAAVEPGGEPVAQAGRPRRGAPRSTGSLAYESGQDEDGRRFRANQYFRFRYFNQKRDFGERAEYEGTVAGALDEARRASERLLGVARTTPTDVILYSRKEFELHHGAWAARAIAGFYSESAIRMNDSAEINDENQGVLVHEYVHAVIDELQGFNRGVPTWLNEGLAEWTKWQYEGRGGPDGRMAKVIKQAALQGGLPPLSQMSTGPLIGMANPAVAYAYAALAVKVLESKRGIREVIQLIRDCGAGTPFPAAYERHYGQDVAQLDAEVAAELRH